MRNIVISKNLICNDEGMKQCNKYSKLGSELSTSRFVLGSSTFANL